MTSGATRVSSETFESEPEVTAEGFCVTINYVLFGIQTNNNVPALGLLPGNSEDQLTCQDINRLAKRLADCGSFNLKFLAAELGIDLAEAIQCLPNASLREQCFDVLMKWQKHARDKATIGNLREALGESIVT